MPSPILLPNKLLLSIGRDTTITTRFSDRLLRFGDSLATLTTSKCILVTLGLSEKPREC